MKKWPDYYISVKCKSKKVILSFLLFICYIINPNYIHSCNSCNQFAFKKGFNIAPYSNSFKPIPTHNKYFFQELNKPIVICTVGPCEPAIKNLNNGICYGHINLSANAKDEKTSEEELLWEYKIDLYNDGKGIYGGYELYVGAITKKQFQNGDTPRIAFNPYADKRQNPFEATGTYPLGVHRICWFVENSNSDVGTCCSLFEVKDCIAPTPICLSGLIKIPLGNTGCVDIWAKDFDHGSFDNCTSKENLKYCFEGDLNKPSIRICCEDFRNWCTDKRTYLDSEMFVVDEEGNSNSCKISIVIEDEFSSCPISCTYGKITGEIKTRKGERTNPALVQLFENGVLLKEVIGSPYSFGNLLLNKTYTIKPTRNDDHINGVSTIDAILIQKHILGKSPITIPYLLIAADVNRSQTISSADISEIRKLILGAIPELSKVPSWTFVSERKVFANPLSPWINSKLDSFSLDTLLITSNSMSRTLNFIAIKMGDVSENARASNLISSTTRIKQNLNFMVEDRKLEIGKEYKIDFNSDNFRKIEGYQFSLNFDPSGMEFARIESGVLDLSEDNFGLNRLDQGIITTSWSSISQSSFKESEILFSLVFRAKRNAQLNELIEISSVVTSAEAYSDDNEVMNIGLKFISNKHSQKTELFRNLPNPFSEWTNIRYYLIEDGLVSFRLYSVTGQMLKEYSLEGTKGINNLEILKKDLNYSGVILYQMETNNYTATKKMLLLN